MLFMNMMIEMTKLVTIMMTNDDDNDKDNLWWQSMMMMMMISVDMTGIRAQCWAAMPGMQIHIMPILQYCMRMMMVVMMTMMTWHGYDDFYIFVSLSEKISTTQSYPQDLQARSALNVMRRNIPDKREKSFLSVQFWNWCFSKFIWQPLLLEVAKQQHFTIYKWNKCDPRPFSGPSQY